MPNAQGTLDYKCDSTDRDFVSGCTSKSLFDVAPTCSQLNYRWVDSVNKPRSGWCSAAAGNGADAVLARTIAIVIGVIGMVAVASAD